MDASREADRLKLEEKEREVSLANEELKNLRE